ncbi:MAG TPA: hypothetical protein VGC04_00050 [Cellulomonas sp.]
MSRAGRARTGVTPAAGRVTATRRAAAAARVRALAAMVLVALVAAACGPSSASGSMIGVAVVTSAADCLAPEVLGQLGLTLDPSLAARVSHTPAPEAGRIPDGFVPTGVLECQVGGQMRDGAGTWTAVTATSRDGSAADVSALVAALDRETAVAGAAAAPTAVAASCAPQDRPVVLWLLDATDRAVRPSLSVDGCGAPRPELKAALDRLAVTGAVDHPVELVTPTS